MRYFVLPFALSVPLAAPLLWYHLDGLDPVDITVQSPSQEEIDFAHTREQLGVQGVSAYGPTERPDLKKERFAEPDALAQSVVSSTPGY